MCVRRELDFLPNWFARSLNFHCEITRSANVFSFTVLRHLFTECRASVRVFSTSVCPFITCLQHLCTYTSYLREFWPSICDILYYWYYYTEHIKLTLVRGCIVTCTWQKCLGVSNILLGSNQKFPSKVLSLTCNKNTGAALDGLGGLRNETRVLSWQACSQKTVPARRNLVP